MHARTHTCMIILRCHNNHGLTHTHTLHARSHTHTFMTTFWCTTHIVYTRTRAHTHTFMITLWYITTLDYTHTHTHVLNHIGCYNFRGWSYMHKHMHDESIFIHANKYTEREREREATDTFIDISRPHLSVYAYIHHAPLLLCVQSAMHAYTLTLRLASFMQSKARQNGFWRTYSGEKTTKWTL